jgi:two-component system chemotaxis response regulator CheB
MPIRVLIVDDSIFIRQVLAKLIESDPELQVVGAAKDGVDALQLVAELQPDVITLDFEMPRMDGLEFLKRLMVEHPVPVVMVSSYTTEGAEVTIQAFELGAVDFITKLTKTDPERAFDPAELIQKIKTAAASNIQALKKPLLVAKKKPSAARSQKPFRQLQHLELLVIGTSTGGPRALHQLLPQFAEDFPLPIIVAQHMPPGFTKVFAGRLNLYCPLEVKEAETGDAVKPGRILIAPSGMQTKILRDQKSLVAEVTNEAGFVFKPSIDYLLKSVAICCKEKVIAVLLTGMGGDGAKSLKELRRLGARTIVEAESSCVVFGMPRTAIEMDAAEFIDDLEIVFERIKEIVANAT